MLLLILTDYMFRPRQIIYRFPRIIFVNRQVTPDEELSIGSGHSGDLSDSLIADVNKMLEESMKGSLLADRVE